MVLPNLPWEGARNVALFLFLFLEKRPLDFSTTKYLCTRVVCFVPVLLL